MAGNRKFHNKFHSANHHTLPSPHIKDSGLDPLASHDFPFIGDFVLNGVVSASNNYLLNDRALATTLDSVPHGLPVPAGWNVFRDSTYVDGDMTITGNLSALGELTYLNTQVKTTSAEEIKIMGDNSDGKTAALTVDQYGKNNIVHFKNDGLSTFLITGSADNSETHGGWIGVNLGALQDVDRPNQRMTVVGSVSVVPDPDERANQTANLNNVGESGSLYIEGGLHVNSHTYLDQLTVNTTDGNFTIEGATNTAADNKFEVLVPTELDKVTIDTGDGDFEVTGTKKMHVTTKDADGIGLIVETPSIINQLHVDTTPKTDQDNDFSMGGAGNATFDLGGSFRVKSPAFFNTLTVDTINDSFKVINTNNLRSEYNPMIVDVPLELSTTKFDTKYGPVLIESSDEYQYDYFRVTSPTHLDELTVNTNNNTMTVSGNGNAVFESELGTQFNTHLSARQVTIETDDTVALIQGTGEFKVTSHTKLSQVTVDTTKGQMLIEGDDEDINDRAPVIVDVPVEIQGDLTLKTEQANSTFAISGDTNGRVAVNVPYTTLEGDGTTNISNRLIVDTDDFDATFIGDNDVIFRNTGVVDTSETKIIANEIDVTLAGEEQVKIEGVGAFNDVYIDAGTHFDKQVLIHGKTTIDTDDGDFIVRDSQATWSNKNHLRVEVPAVTQALSADTRFSHVVIQGEEHDFRLLTDTVFHNPLTATKLARFTDLLDSVGKTELNETNINTTDGKLVVYGENTTEVYTPTIFENDVRVTGDLTVDGHAYLNADQFGNIVMGDSNNDNVLFKADVKSDIVPDTETYSLGLHAKRWNNIFANSIHTRVGNLSSAFANSLNVETDENDQIILHGQGETLIQTPIKTFNSLDAQSGPWVFGGVDEVIEEAVTSLNTDGVGVIEIPAVLRDPAFHVECRSFFSHALTATGPVTIGNLNDKAQDGVPQRTLEVIGNMSVKDGNMYMQSDLRHLHDETTLIRFEEDSICLHVDDTPMFCLKSKNGEKHAKIDSNVSILGNYNIKNTLGDGVDVHGSMRVTQTLSASNLIVDNITVKGEVTGVAAGGGSGTSGTFTALSGVAHENYTTTIDQGDGSTYQFDGVDTGIVFDMKLEDTGKIQKFYSFTFEAIHAKAADGIKIGDTQSSTYHFAVKYDEYTTEAVVVDHTDHTVKTSTKPIAAISHEVCKPESGPGPWTESVVRITIVPNTDCNFYIHNVLVQDRPKGIEHISSADFTILGDLDIQGDVSYNNDKVVFNTPIEINVGVESGIHPIDSQDLGTIEKSWNAAYIDNINSKTAVLEEVQANNIHITGDLRVDGNAYLSAGVGGVINVGDTANDVAVFNADIASDLIPETSMSYDIGSVDKHWMNIYSHNVSAHGSMYWNGGDSNIVNNVSNVVTSLSSDWSAQTDVSELTNTVYSNSAGWDDQSDVIELTTTVQTYSAGWQDDSDLLELTSTVQTRSAYWDAEQTITEAPSLSSDVWNDTHTTLQAYSAGWQDDSDLLELTSTVQTNSSSWSSVNEGGETAGTLETINTVQTYSGNWQDTYHDVLTSKDNWDAVYTDVGHNRGVWTSTYTTLNTYSGDWQDTRRDVLTSKDNWDAVYTDVGHNRGRWNSAFSTVQANSAYWDTTGVASSADDWNETYEWVSDNKQLIEPGYIQTQFVNASGDTISGDLHVTGITYADDLDSVDITTNDLLVNNSAQFDANVAFNKNIYIMGDATVEGNLYLSGGANGNIEVGDSASDTVSIVAGVNDDILPANTDTHDIGSTEKRWSSVHASSGHFDHTIVSDALHINNEFTLTGLTTLAGKTIHYEFTEVEEATEFNQIFNIDTGQIEMVPDPESTITTTVTSVTAGAPNTIVKGTPTGLETTDAGFMIRPDMDVQGDLTVTGAFSANEGYYNRLIAKNFNSEFNKLTIRNGDFEVLDGNIVQRGGTVKVQSDIAHLEDENTYIRFAPDQMTFRCHDIDMIRLSEFPDFDDTIYIGSVSDPVNLNVLSTADEYAFTVDGQTGRIGIGTTLPDTQLHVAKGEVQLASGESGGALMIPSGDTSTRVQKTGSIRFNTQTQKYEGYYDDEDMWSTLGAIEAKSLADDDRDTYITVDARNTDDSDRIAMFTGGCSAIAISPNQKVAFAGEVQFDNIPVYDTTGGDGETSTMEETNKFIFVMVNGKRHGIRLWDIPAEQQGINDNIETLDDQYVMPIGYHGCATGEAGEIPMVTLSGNTGTPYTRLPRFDDSDGDYLADPYDDDDDNDGIIDLYDIDHPLNQAAGAVDTDGDLVIDTFDDDDDNDGIEDTQDINPLFTPEQRLSVDEDSDGIPDLLNEDDHDQDDLPDFLDPDHPRSNPTWNGVLSAWNTLSNINWEDLRGHNSSLE